MWIFTAILSLLTTNLIFTRALGTSTMMTATKNRANLPVLALLMTVFAAAGCLLTSLLFSVLHLTKMLEHPYALGLPLVFTAVISVLYVVILLVLSLFARGKYSGYKRYVHLSAINCAVMGTLYLAFVPTQFLQDAWSYGDQLVLSAVYADRLTPWGAVLFGLQEGIGFLLAALMLSAVRERLYDKDVPAAFRGFPAVMVYLGLISMAIYAIASNG